MGRVVSVREVNPLWEAIKRQLPEAMVNTPEREKSTAWNIGFLLGLGPNPPQPSSCAGCGNCPDGHDSPASLEARCQGGKTTLLSALHRKRNRGVMFSKGRGWGGSLSPFFK